MLNKKEIEIIAEVAQGFEGNFQQSKLLIKAAAKSGANSVKFQLVYADELATPSYKYFNLFKNLEMDENNWRELKTYADELGINLYLDIFGLKSLSLAEKINVEVIKIHGTDITNLGLLEAIAKSSIKSIILGVGGASWTEIKKALVIFKKKPIIIICGFQGYPTKTQDNHIARVEVIKHKAMKIHSDFKMGFADHPDTLDFQATISLVALGAGASVIEKHLTLGKIMEMEDFESAINPDEFASFVTQIRTGTQALGNRNDQDDFGMSSAELTYKKNVRRDVVALENLKTGKAINTSDVTLKRTSNHDAVKELSSVLKKVIKNDVMKNQPLTIKDIN